MIIRPASMSDLNQIVDIAVAQSNVYPKLRADTSKIRALVTDAISAARHFAWVAITDNSTVSAVILAFTTENSWAQRQNSAVLLWWSKTPGAGALLLRKFRDWVKSRRAIKIAGFSPDVDVDPRTWDIVQRAGFDKHGGSYLLYN